MKLGDAKPQTRGENVRLEDLVELVKMANGKWVQIRILPDDILSYSQHWINILASKTKREVRIPKLCLAHDPNTEERTGVCPYCDINDPATSYLVNVVVRQLQDDAPAKNRISREERESGFKNMNSDSWTPVRVLRLTAGLMKKIQELKGLNKVKGKDGVKTFDVDHPKFGLDLNIKYDGNAKGPEKYQVNTGERTALTEDELQYLKWDLSPSLITELGLESLAQAKKELARMQIVGAEEFDDDGDDDDLVGKKKKPASKKPPADDFDDEDDDDDPPPRKKPASKKSVSKKPPADDFDDDDDDEYPPQRKKPASKKPPADDFDDDDDDDDPPPRKKPASKKPLADDFDDEDDDDDPPPRKKPASKKPLADDFDDEDDDDDAPPARRKPAAKKPARKSQEEDFDDDDDLDDDDDAPPARKKPVSKKPVSKKPAKKPQDDDDDFDDDDVPF